MEKDHLVTVEVHYVEQDIAGYSDVPAYRIFLNNELFTERSWLYNNKTFLLEHIRFDSLDINHSISIQPVNILWPEENYYDFELKNLTVDGIPIDPNISGKELHFTINSLV